MDDCTVVRVRPKVFHITVLEKHETTMEWGDHKCGKTGHASWTTAPFSARLNLFPNCNQSRIARNPSTIEPSFSVCISVLINRPTLPIEWAGGDSGSAGSICDIFLLVPSGSSRG